MRLVSMLLVLSVLSGCAEETIPPPPRESIGTKWVSIAAAEVRAKPDPSAAVLTRYQHGEAVSLLAESGEWAEIRSGTGSGWVLRASLADAPSQSTTGTSTPQFEIRPSPVFTQTPAKGEIIFDCTVSISGVVTEVKTLSNTTGSTSLEALNRAQLLRAKFYPLIVKGTAKPFIYTYRVTY